MLAKLKLHILLIIHLAQLGEALWLALQAYLHCLFAPVKTAGAAEQSIENLICNEVIFFHIHLSTFEGSKTHLRIRHSAWTCQLVLSIGLMSEHCCHPCLLSAKLHCFPLKWELEDSLIELHLTDVIKSHSPWLYKVEVLVSVCALVCLTLWP